jgi:mRNA interferase RelE/StbE
VPYRIVWDTAALDTAAGILAKDPDGLRLVMDSIDRLADQPRPAESLEFAGPDVRRLFVALYRILYEIGQDDTITIIMIHRVN